MTVEAVNYERKRENHAKKRERSLGEVLFSSKVWFPFTAFKKQRDYYNGAHNFAVTLLIYYESLQSLRRRFICHPK